jgi:hypothetical protein
MYTCTYKENMLYSTQLLVSISLAAALAVTGCSNKEAPPAPAAAPTSAAPAQPPAAPAAATPVAPAPSSTPAVATADGETPGIKAEIQELKRNSGGTVTLKLTLVNGSSKDLGFGYDFGDPDHHIKDHSSVGGISLIDAVNKKKYLVARDSEDTCLCSRGLNQVSAGERLNVWAKFPAPPDDVQKINVSIPHFSPADDVPISR